jgi:hypothetical protein
MGSGQPATTGLGNAGYVANATTIGPSGQGSFSNGGFGAPFSTVSTNYATWENPNIGNEEIDLGIDYYLGAVAPATPPPPTPPSCTTPHPASAQDQFYVNVNNNPVQVTQGGSASVNLILDGPWIAGDHGNGAVGKVIGDNLPAGSAASTSVASADNQGHSYALMQFYVTVPQTASPGSYLAVVQATDNNSCVVATTNVPITVLACNPQMACPTGGGSNLCGAISNGCGGTLNCGPCASGQTCSNSFCCAAGYFYNTALNTCEPLSCPAGTSFCYYTGACTTAAKCKDSPVCFKVGSHKECY